MKNVIILGASGNIAGHVIDILAKKDDIKLTLFVRDKRRLRNKDIGDARISQKSLEALIANIIVSPEQYARQNLGINKPSLKLNEGEKKKWN